MDVAHRDSIFAKVGSKNSNFRGFSKTFSELPDSNQLKLLISIDPLNIFHWKPAKKIKVGVPLGKIWAKLGLTL